MKSLIYLVVVMVVGCKSSVPKSDVYPKYVFNKCINKWAAIIDHADEGDVYLNEEPIYKETPDGMLELKWRATIAKYCIGTSDKNSVYFAFGALLGRETQYDSKQLAIASYNNFALHVRNGIAKDSLKAENKRREDSIYKCNHTYSQP